MGPLLETKRRKRRQLDADGPTADSGSESGPSAGSGPAAKLSPEEILRRHFESQFGPIEHLGIAPPPPKRRRAEDSRENPGGGGSDREDEVGDNDSSDQQNEDEDAFSGFSDVSEEDAQAMDGSDTDGPEVVDYTGRSAIPAVPVKAPKSERKAFMSHKPPALIPTSDAPSSTAKKSKRTDTSPDSDSDPDTAAAHLKNDLALQRLLRESHLLDAHPSNSHLADPSNPTLSLLPTGKNRHRAINSRITHLGGKDLTKHKMPVPMKRGLKLGRAAAEAKRIKIARDGGIVLEKKTMSEEERKKKEREERKRRENRGFKPAVGKFRNGSLVLSKKDIREIEGGGGEGGKMERRIGGKGGKRKGKKGKK
ncbi:hypothetical protein BDZ91DRAFT_737648 [Kalaharituber pfeilii]|nr:hypothetical protein BDZ91DRAFT_737648 [Kalaharituber pfeilii]